MNSDIRSDDFAARLRRIEEKQRQSVAAKSRGPARKAATERSHDTSDMRNAMIWLILLIVLGTGGYVAWRLNTVVSLGAM